MGVIFYILLSGISPWNHKDVSTVLEQNALCHIDFSNHLIGKNHTSCRAEGFHFDFKIVNMLHIKLYSQILH